MSDPLLFCPAFRLGAHSDSIRSSSPGSSRKRKRSENGAKEDRLQTEGPLHRQGLGNYGLIKEAETTEDSYSSQSESGTSEENFAPLTSPSLSWRRSLPRRKPISGPPRSDGPRQQHLAAVSAILHRCLLQGDYLRAGRAWALLLRSEVNGHPMDVRNQGRWGIGAEILLQESLLQRPDRLRGDQGSTLEDYDGMSTTNSKLRYSECLQPAQDYYDRLIVQYPHRKGSSNAIGPLEFYPVLFGLRIFSEKHNHEDLFRAFQKNHSDNESSIKDGTGPEKRSTSPENLDSERLRITKLLETSITRGKEMGNQLDELLSSPPYSDDIRLQNLRSMIGLWIDDLLASPYFKKAAGTDNRRDS